MALTPQPNDPQRQPAARPAAAPQLSPPSSPPTAPAPAGPVADRAGNGRGWRIGLVAVAAAAIVAVGLHLVSNSATESNHANWQQVREASSRPPGELRWEGADRAVQFLPAIPYSDADRDQQTTVAVKAALERGDVAAAEQIIADAQTTVVAPPPFIGPPPGPSVTPQAPPPPPKPVVAPKAPAPTQPVLTEGMKAEIRRGDTEFFHLFLYDCCDEDGDIVEILLNGQPFRTVTLSNRGVTLSIPVSSTGSTKIQLRGVHDGGGGITVGCRTSRGHGFLRAMGVGDTETLGVVRK